MAAIQGDTDMTLLFRDDEAIDGEETLYQSRVHGVTIIYENLMSEYKKVQKKISKRLMDTKVSCMRVENGSVSIMIDVNSTKYSGCFVAKVVVRREGGAYAETCRMNDGQNKYLGGEVNLNYTCTQEGATKWRLNLDLDSVYEAEENGIVKQVYTLCPSNIFVTNKFQLVTELYLRQEDAYGKFTDRLLRKKESQPFLLRTQPRIVSHVSSLAAAFNVPMHEQTTEEAVHQLRPPPLLNTNGTRDRRKASRRNNRSSNTTPQTTTEARKGWYTNSDIPENGSNARSYTNNMQGCSSDDAAAFVTPVNPAFSTSSPKVEVVEAEGTMSAYSKFPSPHQRARGRSSDPTFPILVSSDNEEEVLCSVCMVPPHPDDPSCAGCHKQQHRHCMEHWFLQQMGFRECPLCRHEPMFLAE